MLNFGFVNRSGESIGKPAGSKFRTLIIANLNPSADPFRFDTPIVSIDRDNLDDVMRRLQPVLPFAAQNATSPATTLAFDSIESLHPDEIFRRSETCERYRRLQRQLRGSQPAAAIQEIRAWSEDLPPAAARSTTAALPNPVAPASSDAGDLTRETWFASVMAETAAREHDEADRWRRFVDELIRPLAIQTVDPDSSRYQAVVDRAIELEVRRVLQDPRVRQLESFWRGLEWLLRRVDTDGACELAVWNVPAEAFAYDLCQDDDLSKSALYRRLVRETVETPGGVGWDLICPLHGFSNSPASLLCLGRFAKIATAAGSAVAVGFSPAAPPESDVWRGEWLELTGCSAAPHLAALSPRFLLRSAYGRQGGRVEQFAFQEFDSDETAGVWGNPAWLAACAAAQQFETAGTFDPTAVCAFDRLATWTFDEDVILSGERLMHEGELAAWLALGLTPVVAYRNRDQVQIHGFQSIARTPWRGSWS